MSKKRLNLVKTLILALAVTFIAPAALTAEDAHHEGGHEAAPAFNLNTVLSHHLMDSPIFEWNIGGTKVYAGSSEFEHDSFRRYVFHDEKGNYKWEGGLPMHITRRVAMMIVVSIILVITMIGVARVISRDPFKVGGRFAGFIEALVSYVREDIAEKNMHGHSKGFQPFILTIFFFILAMNLFGLFPPIGEILSFFTDGIHNGAHHETPAIIALWPGMTVTGDIAVTATFASMITIMIWVTGFIYQGPGYIVTVVPHGVPWPLFPLMWLLEFLISPVAKGFALAIRLLANMTGGHVIILALLGFIFEFQNLYIAPVSVLGAVAIYMLEIFVAFLQAFIFSLLSALFIGSVMHRH